MTFKDETMRPSDYTLQLHKSCGRFVSGPDFSRAVSRRKTALPLCRRQARSGAERINRCFSAASSTVVPLVPASLFIILLVLTALNASAQDTRVVTEPRIPPICTTLHAQLANQTGSTQEDKLDTERIQAAINGCHPGMSVELRADGGKNAFLSGPLELKSGVTLLVAANTTLYASRNPRDFDVTPGSCGVVDQNGKGCKPFIRVHDASNAAVMGEGVIDGQGGAKLANTKTNVSWWDLAQVAKRENTKQNCPRIIVADHADGFTLYKITLRNSPNFHVIVGRTNGFTAWGVKIDSPRTARNTDGIDPSSSINVSILYSYIRAGDDNVAIKAGSAGPAAHITVAHNHFFSGHGMSIGSETSGGVNAIEVDDLTIDGADNGLRIKSDASRGGAVRDVSYRNVCMRDVKNPIMMDPFYSDQTGNLIPDFQEIALHDVRSTTPGEITLEGPDAAHPLKLTMDGVAVDGLKQTQIRAQHAHLTFGPGRASFIPTGEDVKLTNLPGERKPPACEKNVFVPFPEATTSEPSKASHSKQSQFVVAADGSGDFRTVQQAVDALTDEGGTIRIRPGVYREVVRVSKPHVHLEGTSDASQVTIVYGNSAGTSGGTLNSATVSVTADDFSAEGMTFANDFSKDRPLTSQGSQAVALAITGDRAILHNVRMLGAQDTLYAGSKGCASEQGSCTSTRQFFSHCYIEGNVDFIFGDAKAVFIKCEIHAIPHSIVMLTAQSKRYPQEESGFVFDHCKITAEPGVEHIFLGRPWRPYASVVFLNSEMQAHVEPEGWREWHPGETNSLQTAYYAEFNSIGPASAAPASTKDKREPYSHALTAAEAEGFTAQKFLAGADGWEPATADAQHFPYEHQTGRK